MKSELIVRQYKMNKDVTVTVKSKKSKDADIYYNQITLTHNTVSTEPLKIGTRAEIETAIAEIDMDDEQTQLFGNAGRQGTLPEKADEDISGLYTEAERLVKKEKKASVSLLQRRLKIPYGRAGTLIDMLEEAGVVSVAEGSKPRQVLV